MRPFLPSTSSLLALVVLLSAPAASAEPPAQEHAAARPPAAETPPPAAAPRLPLLGLQLNGGLPDGGVASLVVRPLRFVRLDAGLAYNYLSIGAQGGLTLVPFHWGIVPTLRLEAGRFFRRDVTDKVERFVDDVPTYLRPALEGFGYDYASTQLGLELGSQRAFVFFVRGGLAWVRARVDEGTYVPDESPDTEVRVSGLTARASGPTLNLGFLVYLW